MKKLLSLMLALVMLVSLVPTVFATDNSVTVNFSASDGATIIMKEKIAVTDGLAEKYGFEVANADHNGNEIDEPTIFDAIVAAHISLYGEAFTPETAGNYLVMTYSFITKAFGRETATLGFFANDRMPNDGIYNEGYGSYTGLACDTAEIKENDEIVFFFYQDQFSWGDYKADFAEDEITVKVNEDVTLSATAFSSWYGSGTEENIAMNSVAAAGADIYSYSPEGQVEKIATTDENGSVKLSFDKAGEYTVFIAGNVTDMYGKNPLILDWATITVEEDEIETPTEPEEPENPEEPETPDEPAELTFWQKVVNFLKDIADKIVAFFVWVYNSVISLF